MTNSTKHKIAISATILLFCSILLGFFYALFLKIALVFTALLVSALLFVILLFRKRYFIFLIFTLVPFSHEFTSLTEPLATLSLPSEIFSALLSFIIIIYFLKQAINFEIWRHPISILLILDLIWLIITAFTGSDILISTKRIAMKINFELVGYFFMLHWFQNPKEMLKPFVWYGLGLIPIVGLILYAHADYSFSPHIAFAIPQPYFDEHTVYAACIAFIIPIFGWGIFRSKIISGDITNRILLFLGLILLLTGLVFSFSRAAWLSLLFSGLFGISLYWKWTPKIYVYCLVVLVVFLGASYSTIYNKLSQNDAVSNDGDVGNHVSSVTNISSDASNLERINRWVCAWRMFQEKPLMGYGIGNYQFQYAQFQTKEYTTYISTTKGDRGNAHSEYLMYLSETGLPGFLLFMFLVAYIFYLGIRNNLHAKGYLRGVNNCVFIALSTFFIHGLFNSFIDQDKMALLVFPGIAVLVAIDIKIRPKYA